MTGISPTSSVQVETRFYQLLVRWTNEKAVLKLNPPFPLPPHVLLFCGNLIGDDVTMVFLLSSPSIRAVSSVYLVCLPGGVSIAMHTGHPILNQSGLLEHHVACVHTGWFGKYTVRWFQVGMDTLKRTHLLLQLTVFKACQGLASCPRPRTVTCALSPLGRCISGAVDVGGKMLRSEARRSTLK